MNNKYEVTQTDKCPDWVQKIKNKITIYKIFNFFGVSCAAAGVVVFAFLMAKFQNNMVYYILFMAAAILFIGFLITLIGIFLGMKVIVKEFRESIIVIYSSWTNVFLYIDGTYYAKSPLKEKFTLTGPLPDNKKLIVESNHDDYRFEVKEGISVL